MKVKCYNIVAVDLPKEVIIELNEDEYANDPAGLDEAISDALSDKIGFCHFGFLTEGIE